MTNNFQVLNYSFATGLALASTIARYTTPYKGTVSAYKDAWWLGISFGILGFVISLVFIVVSQVKKW